MLKLALALVVVIAAKAWGGVVEPVRDDIVDIRHGRLPDRRVFLGWTADGRAVEHVVVCGDNLEAGPPCEASLGVASERGTDWTLLFRGEDGPTVPTRTASVAIQRERAALAKLAPLANGEVSADLRPTLIDRCDGIWVRLGSRTSQAVSAPCVGDLGDHFTPHASDGRVRSVYVAPDRARAAVVIDYVWSRDADQHRRVAIVVIPLSR